MLLEDLFDVKNIDEDGKKFDNISRISALSQTYNLELTLDVNTEIYPIKVVSPQPRPRAFSRLFVPACFCWLPLLFLTHVALPARSPPHADGRALLAGAVHEHAQGQRARRRFL